MQERQISSLGQEDPLEEETATHSSILAWEIPRTEEAGGLHSMGPQRVRYSWATEQHTLVTGFRRVLEPSQVWGSYRHRPWSVSSWAPLQDPLSPLLTPATTELTKFRFYQPHWLHLKSSSPRCTTRSCFPPVSFLVCSREHPRSALDTHQAGWRSEHSQNRPGPTHGSLRWCFLLARDPPPWRVLRHTSRRSSGGCTKMSASGGHLHNTPLCWLSPVPILCSCAQATFLN